VLRDLPDACVQKEATVAVAGQQFSDKWVALAAGGAVAVGAALIYRELSTRGDTRRRLGGSRGIHVEESITVHRPLSQVFRFWRNFENLPQFMQHLESVVELDSGITHWVAKGPAGLKAEWSARIINEIDDRLIAWQSIAGSTIATAGSVNLTETTDGTCVRVKLQYNPPAGRVGAAVAWLFGKDPQQQIHEDLCRLKALLETCAITTIDGQPSRLIGGHR
jgi:uncharacterized membrane protein